MTKRPDVEALSYEQARDELVGIVAKLEVGAVTLEESLELWERGEALAVRCQHILQGARERIATAGGDGAGEDTAGEDTAGEDTAGEDTADDDAPPDVETPE